MLEFSKGDQVDMTTWVIISWVFVAIFTGINIFVFLKLKNASQQMMKMAFPNAKNMGDAMAQLQRQMAQMGGAGFGGGSRGPMQGKGKGGANPQLQQAMEMLKKMQQGK
jgi:hypothetical protein